MLNHVTHGSTNGPKSINTLWDILGTPPIIISSNTFLWYPPNSTAVNGVYKNPGLTVLPWNFPTSPTWPPFVVHFAAPFQGATGHSPAPWHSRQPHSRLALRHKKKLKKAVNMRWGMAKKNDLSFLVFSWQPMFLDVFRWISLWVFQSRRSTISTSSEKTKDGPCNPRPFPRKWCIFY